MLAYVRAGDYTKLRFDMILSVNGLTGYLTSSELDNISKDKSFLSNWS